MNKGLEILIFIFLLIGTFGLLINEFIFKWGTVATILFAFANILGLFLLGLIYLRKKR